MDNVIYYLFIVNTNVIKLKLEEIMSILIKDTTREERERIVAESIGNIDGMCDGCMAGLADMYQDYIDGKREIKDINMEYRAHFVSGEGEDKLNRGYSCPRN